MSNISKYSSSSRDPRAKIQLLEKMLTTIRNYWLKLFYSLIFLRWYALVTREIIWKISSKLVKVPLALFALQKIKIQGTYNYTIRVRWVIEFPPQRYKSSYIFITKMNNEVNFWEICILKTFMALVLQKFTKYSKLHDPPVSQNISCIQTFVQ